MSGFRISAAVTYQRPGETWASYVARKRPRLVETELWAKRIEHRRLRAATLLDRAAALELAALERKLFHGPILDLGTRLQRRLTDTERERLQELRMGS